MPLVGTPGNVHIRPHIVQVSFNQVLSCNSNVFNIILGLFFAAQFLQSQQVFRNLCLCLFPRRIFPLQCNQTIFTDTFNFGI